MQETGEWVSGDGAPQLFCTDGSGCRLRGKAVYFLRTIDTEEGVDLGKACDETLLFGEVGEQPLQGLESTLASVYRPHFEAKTEWGKAQKSHQKEFMKEVEKFLGGVQASLKSLGDGIDLPKPEKRYDLDNVAKLTQQAKEDPAMIKSFEGASPARQHRCCASQRPTWRPGWPVPAPDVLLTTRHLCHALTSCCRHPGSLVLPHPEVSG